MEDGSAALEAQLQMAIQNLTSSQPVLLNITQGAFELSTAAIVPSADHANASHALTIVGQGRNATVLRMPADGLVVESGTPLIQLKSVRVDGTLKVRGGRIQLEDVDYSAPEERRRMQTTTSTERLDRALVIEEGGEVVLRAVQLVRHPTD